MALTVTRLVSGKRISFRFLAPELLQLASALSFLSFHFFQHLRSSFVGFFSLCHLPVLLLVVTPDLIAGGFHLAFGALFQP